MKEKVSAPRHMFSVEGRVPRTGSNGRAEGRSGGKFLRSLKERRTCLAPKHLARRVSRRASAGPAEQLPALGASAARWGGDGNKPGPPAGLRGRLAQPGVQQQQREADVTASLPKYSRRADAHLSNAEYISSTEPFAASCSGC